MKNPWRQEPEERRPPSFLRGGSAPAPAPPPVLIVRPRRMRTFLMLLVAVVAAPYFVQIGIAADSPEWQNGTTTWQGALIQSMPPPARFAFFEISAALMALAVVLLAARPFLPYIATVDADGVKAWGVFGYRSRPWHEFTRMWTYGNKKSPTLILSTVTGRRTSMASRQSIQLLAGKLSDTSLQQALKVVAFYRPDIVADFIKRAQKPAQFGIRL
ncbi:MAG TPA: hypothetical protein VHA70_14560 [Bauldia sp.]|nr:hypothetical protein [Bauldia sp.]